MSGTPVRRAKREATLREQQAADGCSVVLAPAQGSLPTSRRGAPVAYHEDLCAEVVQLGEHGLSEAEIASHWAIALATLNGWRREHGLFADAMDRAMTAALGWWEGRVREAILAGDTRFAVGAWTACMKARFPTYAERVEVAHTFDVTNRLVVLDLRSPELAAEGQVIESKTLLQRPTMSVSDAR